MRRFVEVRRRRGLKVNADKSTVMVLNKKDGFEYNVCLERSRLEDVTEFKYLECILDGAQCCRQVASKRKDTGTMEWDCMRDCS